MDFLDPGYPFSLIPLTGNFVNAVFVSEFHDGLLARRIVLADRRGWHPHRIEAHRFALLGPLPERVEDDHARLVARGLEHGADGGWQL